MTDRISVAVFLTAVAICGTALAQTAVAPAELPPPDFAGAQYVDSRGCVFVRAATNGGVAWVPRFGADRQPLCGFAPSRGGTAESREVPPPRPAETAEGPDPRPETSEGQPSAAAAEAPQAPDESERPAVAAAEPRPEIIPATPPVVVVPAQPEAPRATLTVIRSRGQVIEVAADDLPRPPLTVIERRGTIDDPQGEPVAPARAQRTRPRLAAPATLASAAPPRVTATDAAAPVAGGRAAGDRAPEGTWVVWDGESPAPLGPGVRWVQTAAEPVTAGSASPRVAAPASPAAAATGPRRLPVTEAAAARSLPPVTSLAGAVSDRARGGARFVQVGAFAVPGNADRTQLRLRAEGLPVTTRRVRQSGRELALVLAGPFEGNEALQAALVTARNLGFRDAYIR